ncbi:hypothetical protein AJ87_35015 [Rhizobium yanglingense]|nr:hypothetical protein AJ87_35015 [Rhizobium yanglingense]
MLYPQGASSDELLSISTVISLSRRLFESDHSVFSLAPSPQGRALAFDRQASLDAESYRLTFASDRVTLSYCDAAGRQYGLTSLAQLLNGARTTKGRFRFPVSGSISDKPRSAGAAAISTCRVSFIRLPTSSG